MQRPEYPTSGHPWLSDRELRAAARDHDKAVKMARRAGHVRRLRSIFGDGIDPIAWRVIHALDRTWT